MKRYKRTYFFALLTILLDFLGFVLAFSLTFWFRFHSGLFEAPRGIPAFTNYLNALPLLLVVLFVVFKSFNLYKERRFFEISLEGSQIFKAFILSLLSMLVLTYFYRNTTYSRLYLLIFVPIGFIVLLSFRHLENALEKIIREKYLRKSRLLILGTGPDADKLEAVLKKDFHWGFKSLESVDSLKLFQESNDIEQLEKTFQNWKKNEIEEIILVSRGITHEQMVKIIYECEKNMISFHLVPDIFNIITSHVDIISIDGISLLKIKRSPLDKLHNRLIKRFIDIAGSFSGLTLFSLPMLFIAMAIKRDSNGPVFFKQKRCGEDGKDFMLFKFRTMSVNAEGETGPVFASENDPRKTKIGRWLRSKNLDELPQLWNVLKGDMSLVGPRPERPHFVEKFKQDIPKYMSRHLIRSGITGWAQIHGFRGNTSIEERIKHDLYYIENWSIFLDIRILFQTLFSRKNAY